MRMLEETLDEWAEEKFRLGRAAGMERGRFKGRIEGECALLIRQAQVRLALRQQPLLAQVVGHG